MLFNGGKREIFCVEEPLTTDLFDALVRPGKSLPGGQDSAIELL